MITGLFLWINLEAALDLQEILDEYIPHADAVNSGVIEIRPDEKRIWKLSLRKRC